MRKRPTMRDIAEASGFSINTVSRALGNKAYVKPDTRKVILKVAAQMGYHPNKLAWSLRLSTSQTLGVIIADIANPYFGALVKGIEREAGEWGFRVILLDTDEDYGREAGAVEALLEENVAGIIITPTQRERGTIQKLLEIKLPFVLVSRRFPDLKTNYVVTDDVHGGQLAAEHLVTLGHRRIGMVNGPEHISSARERFQGYRETMERHHLVVNPSYIITGAVTMQDGYEAARELLTHEPLPTALFTFSDFVAFGAMKAIREAGLQVPEDISVVGYDDNQFASCMETPLTTVRVPKEQLGMEAARVLKGQLEDDQPVRQVELVVELVVRESTMACKS
jgi:LacI family transcriptional regulator